MNTDVHSTLVKPVPGNKTRALVEAGVVRRFTTPSVDVYDMFEWEVRDTSKRKACEFPKFWSQNAADIVAGKYFRVVKQQDGSFQQETSVKQMISRVVDTLTAWAADFGHVAGKDEEATFNQELKFLLVTQSFSFNSPVWFNIGTNRGKYRTEQASACFINNVEDDMASIAQLGVIEATLYKGGSGSGVNYSKLRSSREGLSGGGTASGPVPFIAKDDANSAAIKSGGTTRRAAKMAILNVDHGDIVEFIECKARAEKMAQALIDAGFDDDFRGRFGAYQSVPFQNANHSVRVTDEFMQAVVDDKEWSLRARTGVLLETMPARKLWDGIADAAWWCGDPGLQFDTTINEMHTTPKDGRINASNPCSEYMHIDDSACNLASLNLRRFQHPDGSLNIDDFEHAIDVTITAMDAIVDGAGYPTPKIAENASRFRQLGLGFANLGAFLMAQGIAYDSVDGRLQAGMITAIMGGRAYRRSAELASRLGPFAAYPNNRDAMQFVMQKHLHGVHQVYDRYCELRDAVSNLFEAAHRNWIEANNLGMKHGFRNSQSTVLAPTGTIAFMMDCDTTGIEPDVALTKDKKLVGGGTMRIVNQSVDGALQRLGYDSSLRKKIIDYMHDKGSVVGSGILDGDLAVFDTALPDPVGHRSISAEGHVLMMGAVQPFLSGAISKTVNMPPDSTAAQIAGVYMLAWREKLKAIAVYRDGCKKSQPIGNAKAAVPGAVNPSARDLYEKQIADLTKQLELVNQQAKLHRHKLPDDCDTHRHKFYIGEHKGYLHCGMYPDGTLGEIFIKMNKEGSTVSGLMDSIATLTSIALQYSVPLDALVKKFKYTSFEPSGWTGNEDLKQASSIMDYIFRYLGLRFLNQKPIEVIETKPADVSSVLAAAALKPKTNGHRDIGKLCPDCGALTQRTGACHTCPSCGWNGGCG